MKPMNAFYIYVPSKFGFQIFYNYFLFANSAVIHIHSQQL